MKTNRDWQNALLRPVTRWSAVEPTATGPITGLFVVIARQADGRWYQATDGLSSGRAEAVRAYLNFPGSYREVDLAVILERN